MEGINFTKSSALLDWKTIQNAHNFIDFWRTWTFFQSETRLNRRFPTSFLSRPLDYSHQTVRHLFSILCLVIILGIYCAISLWVVLMLPFSQHTGSPCFSEYYRPVTFLVVISDQTGCAIFVILIEQFWFINTITSNSLSISNSPCSLTRRTTHNLAFHSLLRWNIVLCPQSSLGDCTFWTCEWKGSRTIIVLWIITSCYGFIKRESLCQTLLQSRLETSALLFSICLIGNWMPRPDSQSAIQSTSHHSRRESYRVQNRL